MNDHISPHAFLAADGTADWRVVGDGACAFYPTDSLTASVALVAAVAALPPVVAHPPAIDIRADGVTFRLLTTDDGAYGMSERDLAAARAISTTAAEQGFAADPERVQSVLVIPGTADPATVMPFWEAALGYVRRADTPDEDLVDPRDRGPAFWFEAMDQPRGDLGGAIHVAVWVPGEVAEARVAAALAAGGHLVRDDRKPSWWTLADTAGNEVDISTIGGRS